MKRLLTALGLAQVVEGFVGAPLLSPLSSRPSCAATRRSLSAADREEKRARRPYGTSAMALQADGDDSADRSDAFGFDDLSRLSRRGVLALAAAIAAAAAADVAGAAGAAADDRLVWTSKADILGRAREAGGSAASGKNVTYPVRFVTYLARILLNYDAGSKQLWDKQARRIPLSYSATQVAEARRKQFAEFAEAVELGLQDYQGATGAKALLSLLRSRYADTPDRERQLAILFSFAPGDVQPTRQLQQLLGQVDDARLSVVDVTDRGSGYSGRAPKVTVAAPPAEGGEPAVVRAVLRETGKIARLELPPPDASACIQAYSEPPEVRISPPADPTGVQATARAILDPKGRLIDLKLLNPGEGYSESIAPVTVEVFGTAVDDDGLTAIAICESFPQARAVLDREVAFLDIVRVGTGYATAVPVSVTIEPPQACGGEADGTGASAIAFLSRRAIGFEPNTLPLPDTSLSSQLTQLLPSDVVDTLVFDPNGQASILGLEGVTSAADRGTDSDQAAAAAQGGGLPVVTPAPFGSTFDPVFGPIGRSPVQQETGLRPSDYLRLALSGALCNGVVRVALHPVDTVKTRMQAEPGLGRGAAEAYKTLSAQGGQQVLKGIDVSAILGFLLGFFGFGCTEIFRRGLEGYVGPEEIGALQVPIILAASGGAQLVNSIVTCPWEGVRIRVMTKPGPLALGNFIPEFQDLFKGATGPGALFGGLGPLLFRELPFAVTKFLVFELSRDAIYTALPATQEGVFSSLVVSLCCGMLGGVAAAIVSNPADAVLTRLNAPHPSMPAAAGAGGATVAEPGMRAAGRARGVSIGSASAAAVGHARRALAGRGGQGAAAAAAAEAAAGSGRGRQQRSALAAPPGEASYLKQQRRGAQAPLRAVSAGKERGNKAEKRGIEVEGKDPPPQMRDWREELKAMQREPGGLMNLFSGIGVRSTFFGALIALQFFLYDYFKVLLQVSPDDLKLVLDVFADRMSFYETMSSGM